MAVSDSPKAGPDRSDQTRNPAVLARVVDAGPDIMGAYDPEGRIVFLNRAGRQWCGLPEGGDAPLPSCAALYPPEVAKMIKETALPVAAREGSWRGESTIRDRAGRDHPVDQLIIALREADGTLTGYSTIIHDVSDRRKAERALRESEEIFSKAFYLSPDPYVIVDDTTNQMVDVNDAYCRRFGLTREEAIGRRNSELGLWADLEERDRFVEIMRRDGEVREMEQHRRTRSGEAMICLVSAFLIDIGGRPCTFFRMRDITRERLAEQALRESEERFSKAFHASLDPIAIGEFPSGRMTEVNDAYCQLFGYAREEIVGRSDGELGLWADLRDRDRFIALLTETGAVREMEADQLARTGGRITCRITAHRLEIGGYPRIVTRLTDITEQRKALRALRESEEKFSKAFHATPDSVSITTFKEGRFLEVNDGFTRIHGWTRAEALGRTPADLGLWSNPADRERLRARLEAGQPVNSVPVVHRDKTGGVHQCLFSADRIEVGGQACMLAVVRDVTEQQRLEDQLRQAQKMESVGQLAGGVAHDFNNILTVVQGHTSFLLQDPALPANVREALDQIQESAGFAANLTRQLLLFSRRQVLQPGRLALHEVVARMTQLLDRVIGENIALEVTTPPGLPDVQADAGMVEQVLLNLVVNARDALPRGGRITIATRALTADADYVRRVPQARPGRFVGLSVHDTGEGIAPEVLPRIFDPFFTTKQEGKGTGLGLAMVYGIMEQHAGWIEVESQQGRGTTFEVWFPAADKTTAAPMPVPAPPADTHGSETVLVVEDKDAVRNVLQAVLERFGYRVVLAKDGPDALARWAEHKDRIALLFTDVMMPGGLTGKDLADRLRAERPGLKVVFCSGYDANILDADALQAAGTRFLTKPFDVTRLTAVVRELLDAK